MLGRKEEFIMTMTSKQIRNNSLKMWKKCKKDVGRHWQQWQVMQENEDKSTQAMIAIYKCDDWLKQMSQEYGLPYETIAQGDCDLTADIERFRDKKEFSKKFFFKYLQVLKDWNRILDKKSTVL